MEKVSNDFLDFKKTNFPRNIIDKTNRLMTQFSSEYCKGEISKLDITELSCRARVYLLIQIMAEKRKLLPSQLMGVNPVNEDDFDALCKSEVSFEKKYWAPYLNKSTAKHHWQIQDKNPTIFLIGNQEYTLELLYTRKQPGNGRIKGIDAYEKEKSMTHEAICSRIDKLGSTIEKIFQKILKQKKDGKFIKMGCPAKEKLLNGYSFLLDFEIARRKVPGDIHENLPLITCFPFLMKHLASISKLPFSEFYTTTFSKLFEGIKRRECVEGIIGKIRNIIPTTIDEMRDLLNDFHQSDEVSSNFSSLESQSQSILSQQ